MIEDSKCTINMNILNLSKRYHKTCFETSTMCSIKFYKRIMYILLKMVEAAQIEKQFAWSRKLMQIKL
jgi:hypothetical protein